MRRTPPTQLLSVDQIFVMFDANNSVIRYAMSNEIGPVLGEFRGQTSRCLGCSWKPAGRVRLVPPLRLKVSRNNVFVCLFLVFRESESTLLRFLYSISLRDVAINQFFFFWNSE